MFEHPAVAEHATCREVTVPTFKDISRQRFGRLVAIRLHARGMGHGKGRKHVTWFCECDCGNHRVVSISNLLSGTTRSCGCTHLKHGHAIERARTGTYISWVSMIQRCTNPNSIRYEHYGARGITVCERWLSFANFLADMGPRPPHYSIERINNDGNYEPLNCKWIPRNEQQKNQRPNHGGKKVRQLELQLPHNRSRARLDAVRHVAIRRGKSKIPHLRRRPKAPHEQLELGL